MSIGKQNNVESLAAQGSDLSRYKGTAVRGYRLCTTCGSRDGLLGVVAFVLTGFLGLQMVKGERRRRLFLVTGELPRTGAREIRDLGLLLILLSGAALFVGNQTYLLESIPVWTAAVIFLPFGLVCRFGSRSRFLHALFQSFERRMEEAGLSKGRRARLVTCPHCDAPSLPGAISCSECGSMI